MFRVKFGVRFRDRVRFRFRVRLRVRCKVRFKIKDKISARCFLSRTLTLQRKRGLIYSGRFSPGRKK